MSADATQLKSSVPAPRQQDSEHRSEFDSETVIEPPDTTPPGRLTSMWPAIAAVAVWAVATPVAVVLPRLMPGDSVGLRSWAFPLAAGLAGGAVLLGLALRRPTDRLAGITAGFFSAWVVLMLSTAMRGTPFPFFGLLGDSGRITAMATRYSTTMASSDAWIPGLPAEYPPLFPWLVGRASVLSGVEAWRLVGDAEIAFTGLALLVGFLLWQRLVPPWVALATTVLGFMFFAIPAKSYEVLTLMAFIPWVLGTFGRPARGRLHWAVSGLVGGMILVTYYGWLVFGAIGIVILAVSTWRSEPNRRAFLIYLAKAAGLALVLASWFIVPLIYGKITIGGPNVGDLYGVASLLDQMFPFLDLTVIGLLQLTGLVGLIWLRGKVWWAWPMLALVIGAYLYRIVFAVMFVLTQHTGLSQYTPRLYGTIMAMAGVLTLVHAVPKLLQRLSLAPPRGGLAILLAVAMAWCGYTFTLDWMPNMGGRYSFFAERAYLEPLPNGTYVIDTTGGTPTKWFPVTPIKDAVERQLGPNPKRVTLSSDERLFAYLPWPGYAGNDLGSSVSRSLERLAEVQRIGGITDPAAFTRESAQTKFGPIDIFVLSKKDGAWEWTFHQGFNQPDVTVRFTPAQFDAGSWVVVDNLPSDTVVAIRR